MKIEIRRKGDVTIFDVSGKIMGDESLELRRYINDWLMQVPEGKVNLILNMGKVTGIDSSGLGVLVASYTSVKRKGGRIVLLNLGRGLRNLVTLTRLNLVFDIYNDEEEACLLYTSPSPRD